MNHYKIIYKINKKAIFAKTKLAIDTKGKKIEKILKLQM